MNRYSRLLELEKITPEKLDLLSQKKILIIGVGGVGQHIVLDLVTNGVTNVTCVDFDVVEISNLNRQILVTEEDIGKPKVEVVQEALLKHNSEAKIKVKQLKVDESNVDQIIQGYDVVVDAVDNWLSRLVIAKACQKVHQIYLHVGVSGESGQYCLFKDKTILDIVNPDIIKAPRDGVSGPMVGLISSFASLHLLDYLLGEKCALDTLYFYRHENHEFNKIKF